MTPPPPSRTSRPTSDETIRIRPKRRTRPRRIGPLWLPFWLLARHTRRTRPWLWWVTRATLVASAVAVVGMQFLTGLGDVAIPPQISGLGWTSLLSAMGVATVLRLADMSESPDLWNHTDLRWLQPDPLDVNIKKL